jgi:ribonuclease-3
VYCLAIEPHSIEDFEKVLNYTFQNRALALEALTHASYSNEHRDVDYDNERLEFLGDAVLGMVVSTRLLEQYPEEPEGVLSRYKAVLVSERGLHFIASEIDLGVFLYIGHGELLSGGRTKTSLLANAVESIIAAVFLDGGFDAATALVERLMGTRFERASDLAYGTDHKTRLQEWVQATDGHRTPTYQILADAGPDHEKEFEAAVLIAEDIVARGRGSSKKEAEQQAAKIALGMLTETQNA